MGFEACLFLRGVRATPWGLFEAKIQFGVFNLSNRKAKLKNMTKNHVAQTI